MIGSIIRGPSCRIVPLRAMALCLSVAAVLTGAVAAPQAPPPDPDTSAMEKQVGEAIAEGRAGVVAAPGSADAWGSLGRVLHAHELRSGATICYRRAAELAPADPRWPYLAALASKDAAEAALPDVRRAAGLKPDYAPAHLLAARLEEQLGRPDVAREDYRKALEADPESAAALFGLGSLLLAGGDVEGAVQHLERARSLQPNSGSIRALLARAYHRLGRREDAKKEADAAKGLTDDIASSDPLRGWVDDAAVSTMGYERRAAAAEAAGDHAAAERFYRRLVELRPDDARMRFNLGFAIYRQGRGPEAQKALQEALELDPDLARAHLILGSLLLASGKVSEGLKHFEPPTLQAEHAEFFVDLGLALMEEGHIELASYFFGKAAGLDPRSADAHQGFGQLLSRKGRFLEAAAHHETAIELDPWAGGIHVDLAIALAGMGRHAEAWSHIQAARSMGTTPPEDFLGWLRQQMPEPPARP